MNANDILGVPLEFVLFAATLIGVALLHHHVLTVALTGLAAITLLKLGTVGFHAGPGLAGLGLHLEHEWVTLANLMLLLLGFALLAAQFETSRLPEKLPRLLPDDWTGGFLLLCLIFALSAILDNIAAAMIGGTIAMKVFGGRVHIGYLAAIVAASNAGGSGSVVGDTTTTMMWIAGVHPIDVLHAYIAAVPALFVFGIPAARVQQRFSPIVKEPPAGIVIDHARVWIVAIILAAAIAANVLANLLAPALLDDLPLIGLAIWAAIAVTALIRPPDWHLIPQAAKGTAFLLSLVLAASMMPVEALPTAGPQTALGLGFVSAVFDNIPLTALALRQGGYDWGFLAYAVGFGGSMLWFGSSAGVALANEFEEAKSVGAWVRHGWPVAAGYLVGFAVLWSVWGWRPG